MFYREMQDGNINMEDYGMQNPQQMPYEDQTNPMQQYQMENPEINQQQMPMGQCPYLNQGMCTNPNAMYQQSTQQPMTGEMGYPMDYNYPQQNQRDFSDGSEKDSDALRQFGWNGFPYGVYPYGVYPYGGYPYGPYPVYPYGGYPYGHGWYGHHGWHGHR